MIFLDLKKEIYIFLVILNKKSHLNLRWLFLVLPRGFEPLSSR
jgi:hypothetical protein